MQNQFVQGKLYQNNLWHENKLEDVCQKLFDNLQYQSQQRFFYCLNDNDLHCEQTALNGVFENTDKYHLCKNN